MTSRIEPRFQAAMSPLERSDLLAGFTARVAEDAVRAASNNTPRAVPEYIPPPSQMSLLGKMLGWAEDFITPPRDKNKGRMQ